MEVVQETVNVMIQEATAAGRPVEHIRINNIDYLFITGGSGWVFILEKGEGVYYPVIQAADRAHAVSYCNMRECPRVPFTVM